MRVLEWIVKRCEEKGRRGGDAHRLRPRPRGHRPRRASGVSEETLRELLTVDKETWKQEADGIEEFYKQFGDRLPQELADELATLKANLNK